MRKSISKRIRLIKSHRLYSTKELAEELGVHPRSVQQWQKEGLSPIDPDCKPFVFRGQVAKDFLKARHKARKQKLQDGEFYCPSCQRPVESIRDHRSCTKMGLGNRGQAKGKCFVCGNKICRFISKEQLESGVYAATDKLADRRLYESQHANVNTDLGKGTNHD